MMQAQKPKLDDFEGLVFTTARMFASQVNVEEEDLRQELRIVVWRATSRFDPSKTRVAIGNFVYGCVANRVKDLKRNAARRAAHDVTFTYIEDNRASARNGCDAEGLLDHFEMTYMHESSEQVYGRVDEGLLTLPATLTQCEAEVLVLMMFDMTEREIRLRLRLSSPDFDAISSSLRAKLADWDPGTDSQSVELTTLVAA